MVTRHLTSERLVLTIATVVVVGVLAIAIWSLAFASAGTADQPRIDADVQQRYESIDGVNATQTTTITRNGTVASQTTYAAALQPGTQKKRLAVVNSTVERYDRRVSNGSMLWLYDQRRENATRITLSRTDSEQGERLQRLFANLNMSTAADTTTDSPSVEPLPVVPRGEQRPTVSAGSMTVSYRGTEAIDGREAYVIHVAPKDDTAAYEQTIWVDTEQFFPVKKRTAWTADGERTVVTTTHTNVTYDTGVSDDVFTPDFPDGTTVTVPETPERQTYESVGALEADTEVQVPEPDIPPGYELTYATQTRGRVHSVGLRYMNRTSLITVAKYDRPSVGESTSQTATIDGQPVQVSYGLTTSVSWSCERYRYTIRGEGVSADRLITVGQSIGCPSGE
ncbi:outer membrane lipoprotein carrier protein LolA [Haloarcula sp. CBA1130]|uniref:LolA family protein n=1 Tax=unclassified Haloarcula TaxID=2624677 RepID=UPI0012462DA4|nr:MULTISPECIES: outer membrane lipoprotein carrier protein LolA [unclassified Haloarcula]KAA9399553.1 outer membrane lipoprotein carrier protein LolA [Haloarcula sp. CBA1129]KAA9401277.1 outer membrane lipoprotein carrier protein LolA [Haloarcula sp. CBA1130]